VSARSEGGGRHAGVDWSWTEHALCVVDDDGAIVERLTVEHSAAGLTRLVAVLRGHVVSGVAIERGDGPVVSALLEAGLAVFVITSRQVQALRLRYGAAGNKDDRFDAYVLADVLRTDRRRLVPLTTDGPDTLGLRMLVRARKDLVAARVAAHNQLRSHLLTAFPGAVGLFSHLDGAISLKFLARFPSPRQGRWLSDKRLASWLASVGYSGPQTPAQLMTHLRQAPSGLQTTAAAAAGEAITQQFVALLISLRERIAAVEEHIAQALAAHADAHIFTSLPRSGTVRAAMLLAEIGDCRGRFPTEDSLAAAAGVSPSTRSSGRSRAVVFRYGCNRRLRQALIDFADDSRHGSPWAQDIYARARARGARHAHAVRILARAWIRVIWRCWTDNTPYDPARHGGLILLQRAAS
jgi:transposase